MLHPARAAATRIAASAEIFIVAGVPPAVADTNLCSARRPPEPSTSLESLGVAAHSAAYLRRVSPG